MAIDDPNDVTVDADDMPGESRVTIEAESAAKELSPAEKKKKDADEQILKTMRKRMRAWLASDEFYQKQAIQDRKVRAGKWGEVSHQWPEGIESKRKAAKRPCETINRMPSFINQVTNTIRAARLMIQVKPIGDTGDPATAAVIQGEIRNIEVQSYSDRALASAADGMAEIGRSYMKLATEYRSNDPEDNNLDALFLQRIRIKEVQNHLAIGMDPTAREVDKTDANYAFELVDIDRDDFKDVMETDDEPPEETSMAAFDTEGSVTGDWFPNKKIRCVNYYSREAKGSRVRYALLSTGKVITYPTEKQQAELEALGITVVSDREVQAKQIICRKCTALKIYSTTIWPAPAPPFIEMVGQRLEIDGVKDWRGVVRDATGPQRAYNVQVSGLIELVGLGQKAPVVGYRGQFGAPGSTMRKAWAEANTDPKAFLEVEIVNIDGKAVPFPQHMNFDPPISGVLEAIRQTDQDLKNTAGFQDASLGEAGPAESAKAILARQKQDELGSSHYLDNARFALVAMGRQLIHLIRAVNDTPRVITYDDKVGRRRKVMVFTGKHNDPRNEEFLKPHPQAGQEDPANPGQMFPKLMPFALPEGVESIHDLGEGEYHIEVQANKDSGTRREQAFDAMSGIFKALPPELSMKFLDLYFEVLDTPNAPKLVDRAEKLIGIDKEGNEQIPAAAQAKLQQLEQALKELTALHQEAVQKIQTDEVKVQGQVQIAQLNNESKERVAAFSAQATMAATVAKLEGEKAIALINGEIKKLAEAVELSRAEMEARGQRAHEKELLDKEQQHEIDKATHEAKLAATAQGLEHGHTDHATSTANAEAAASQGREHAHAEASGHEQRAHEKDTAATAAAAQAVAAQQKETANGDGSGE